ncbi:MAG: nucleoside hydrolase [Cyclobacteriaceae bacterium]|nr:nucleoside hydrolase [Cyclobacteriaceae bacterium SS2]
MKTPLNLFLLILFNASLLSAQPVKIIFDTDMESDVDDVAALAMLHGLADRGAAEILATISSSLNPWSAPTIDVINTYFRRPDIPIGNVKTKGVYRNSIYAKPLSEQFPQDIGLGEKAQEATSLYRRILSEQEDASVVIVTVGYLTNLSKLLSSEPDEFSPLNGMELVKKKVKHYVCMGGRYPQEQDPGKWGNFKPDPEAVVHVTNEWPTLITFTTGGVFSNAIPTGKILFTNKAEKGNPVSTAYKIFLKSWNRDYHHSADLIAVYVAVRGHEPYFTLREDGYFHIFEDGTHMWRFKPNRPNHKIVSDFAEGIDPLQVAADFDELLIK